MINATYNFLNVLLQVVESINSHKFIPGVRVEVVDKMCVSAMKVAKIEEVVGGRLRLNYVDSKVSISTLEGLQKFIVGIEKCILNMERHISNSSLNMN